MQSLASRLFPSAGRQHPGDLAWEATCQGAGEPYPSAVWTDADRTVAWGWLESPGGLLLQVDPAYPALADEVLAWAENTVGANTDTAVSTMISGNEPHLAAALEARGYAAAADGPFFSCLGRTLTNLPQVPLLPPGYTIRPQYDAEDVANRAAAHRAAWNSPLITAERHAAMRELWPYRPECDLMALSPTGEAVAYYQGWYDETSGIGLFEPVGTAPEHRRLGLSRALGIAVLHAFAAAGGRYAVVNPRGDADYPVPKLVYESFGFTAYSRTYTYTR